MDQRTLDTPSAMPEDQKAEVVTTASATTSKDLSPWSGQLESISKAILGLVGFAYVIGLFILNFHVRRYGIYYLNFLQIEYVMVGALWIILVGWTYCLLAWIFFSIKNFSASAHRILSILSLLLSVFGGYSSLVIVLNVLTEAATVNFLKGHWRIIFVLCLGAISVFNVGTKVKPVVDHFRSPQQKKLDMRFRFAHAFDASYFAILLIVGLSSYAAIAFPKISPIFGGGKPQKAEFLIKADSLGTVKAIGLQLPDSGKVGPLEVVFEASDFFLIIPPQGFANDNVKAIRLNKDLIDAAFYLGSK